MHAAQISFDMNALQASWQRFDAVAHLRSIKSESEYDRMIVIKNCVLDKVGGNEDHPLSGLLEIVSELVSKYEQEQHAIKLREPKDALRCLMDERGLKQSELVGIIPQSNLSAVLAGKRKISASLASKLGKFFGVSPAVFIAE